ncbi:hypothetical protein [Vibrio barjaei]|uniref:Uncharacterized protein n=1 Tax=Vibrio barjaei TaxID=1676683 RepID=A0ABW7IQ89_9VIBR|nr:hypothetical protein [Vibrio barjaei]OIN24122.1 hypothetical protein AWH66_2003155 [Vibrio barjaei]
MKTSNAMYQPHIQQHLKDTTKFINGYLKSGKGDLTASLNGQNQIKIRNAEGAVVKTYDGEKIAEKKAGVDTYV